MTCPAFDPPDAEPAEPGPPDTAASVVPESEEVPPTGSATVADGSKLPEAAPKDWRTLIQEQQPRAAVEMIEAAGSFDQTCQTAPLSDLTILADAARHAGRPQRARQVYTAIRTRFAGSEAAATSGFYLARLAWREGSRQRARMWFSTYLAERPSGPLAQEALGRMLEIDRDVPSQARETARRYLAQFPGGPHASLAHSVLAQPIYVDGGSAPDRVTSP